MKRKAGVIRRRSEYPESDDDIPPTDIAYYNEAIIYDTKGFHFQPAPLHTGNGRHGLLKLLEQEKVEVLDQSARLKRYKFQFDPNSIVTSIYIFAMVRAGKLQKYIETTMQEISKLFCLNRS